MGVGILGVLAVLSGLTLIQPQRFANNHPAQIALRCFRVVLVALAVWAAWEAFAGFSVLH
jgi:hypothetical protein